LLKTVLAVGGRRDMSNAYPGEKIIRKFEVVAVIAVVLLLLLAVAIAILRGFPRREIN